MCLNVLQQLLEVDITAIIAHGEAFFIVAALVWLPLRMEAYRMRRLPAERCEQLELQVQKLRVIVALYRLQPSMSGGEKRFLS